MWYLFLLERDKGSGKIFLESSPHVNEKKVAKYEYGTKI
jgi:hypothetical protein